MLYIILKVIFFSINDVNHIIFIYDANKMCLKNSFFHFYFLNTDISITVNGTSWIFKPCL